MLALICAWCLTRNCDLLAAPWSFDWSTKTCKRAMKNSTVGFLQYYYRIMEVLILNKRYVLQNFHRNKRILTKFCDYFIFNSIIYRTHIVRLVIIFVYINNIRMLFLFFILKFRIQNKVLNEENNNLKTIEKYCLLDLQFDNYILF